MFLFICLSVKFSSVIHVGVSSILLISISRCPKSNYGRRGSEDEGLVLVSLAAVTSDPNISVTFNNQLSFWFTSHACAIGTTALGRRAELWLGCALLCPSFRSKTQAEEAEEKEQEPAIKVLIEHRGCLFLLIIHWAQQVTWPTPTSAGTGQSRGSGGGCLTFCRGGGERITGDNNAICHGILRKRNYVREFKTL